MPSGVVSDNLIYIYNLIISYHPMPIQDNTHVSVNTCQHIQYQRKNPLEILPKGSRQPFLGINLGYFQKTYRMSR